MKSQSWAKEKNPNYKGKNTWEKVDRICKECGITFQVTRGNLLNRPCLFHTRSCGAKFSIKNNPERWIGKRRSTGYILIHLPNHPNANSDGYYAEHRLVIEKSIGRYLQKEEIVHHLNRIRDDNRLENLELVESKGKHTHIHKHDIRKASKIYWSLENRKKQAERMRLLNNSQHINMNRKGKKKLR